MTPEKLKELRALGIQSVTLGSAGEILGVTFFPAATPEAPDEAVPADFGAAKGDVCRCKHFDFEHGEHGACLRGCPESACAPEEKAS